MNTLKCDYCGEENYHVPIIQKPTRFGFGSRVFSLAQINNEGRKLDNVCLDCLKQEIDHIKFD